MRARAFLHPLDYLRTPPTIQEDLENRRPHLDFKSPSNFVLDFPSPWSPGACSSVLSVSGLVNDESCKDDVEDEFAPVLEDTWKEKRYEVVRYAQKIFTYLMNRDF